VGRDASSEALGAIEGGVGRPEQKGQSDEGEDLEEFAHEVKEGLAGTRRALLV
jgi:hypothetical protein